MEMEGFQQNPLRRAAAEGKRKSIFQLKYWLQTVTSFWNPVLTDAASRQGGDRCSCDKRNKCTLGETSNHNASEGVLFALPFWCGPGCRCYADWLQQRLWKCWKMAGELCAPFQVTSSQSPWCDPPFIYVSVKVRSSLPQYVRLWHANCSAPKARQCCVRTQEKPLPPPLTT